MNPETEDFVRKMIGYFSTDILAAYRNQSHKYKLWTDYFEGKLSIRDDYYTRLPGSERAASYINIRFGFRGQRNGELAVAAWLPDLAVC